MPETHPQVRSVPVPHDSRVARLYESTDLADAYEIRLPSNAVSDPEALARFVFAQQAPWMVALMRVRDAVVAGFGLKTSRQLKSPQPPGHAARVGIFRIYETHPNEIVLGEDDKHLDFRLSVLRQVRSTSTQDESYLTLSTVVHCNNRLGRAYIVLIAPFHRLIVQAMLRRAARAGWPQRASA